jgi:hypothetical protein
MTVDVLHRKLEMANLRYAARLLGGQRTDSDGDCGNEISGASPGVVMPQDA